MSPRKSASVETPAPAPAEAAEAPPTHADILAAGRTSLPAASQMLLADIDAEEQAMIASDARSVLDRDALRLKLGTFTAALQAAAAFLEPGAPAELPGFIFGLEEGRVAYLASSKAHGKAPSGVQVYSAKAKDAAALALVQIADFRTKVGERVAGLTATETETRSKAGVGESPAATAVADVARIGNSQLDLLADPAALELMRHKSVYPERSLARLTPLVKQLDGYIDAGIGTDPRRGAAAVKVNNALLKIQVTLSRAVVFLREFGAKDQATLIDDQLPKRFHRRATDPEASPHSFMSPKTRARKAFARRTESKASRSISARSGFMLGRAAK